MQARETVVVNAADAIVAQHSRTERHEDEFTQRKPYITAESRDVTIHSTHDSIHDL